MGEYWPDVTITSLPKYYSDWDEKTFVLQPPADDNYQVELAFTYRPDGLGPTNQATWIATKTPRLLFAACMSESAIFNKMDDAEIAMWEAYYERALSGVTQEQMTRQRSNENESGEIG
jgi:hypothetical protein